MLVRVLTPSPKEEYYLYISLLDAVIADIINERDGCMAGAQHNRLGMITVASLYASCITTCQSCPGFYRNHVGRPSREMCELEPVPSVHSHRICHIRRPLLVRPGPSPWSEGLLRVSAARLLHKRPMIRLDPPFRVMEKPMVSMLGSIQS